jgi:DNA-directed RNA polymerase subunit beta'
MQNELKKSLAFCNDIINKKKLQSLMSEAFHNYGIVKSALIADRVKNLTFHYATLSGISLTAEDLRVPDCKGQLMRLTGNEVIFTEQKHNIATITSVERYQKIIDIWNNASNTLKEEVLTYFRESDPLNPLYIMAFSGARGNISQVRQLVGMRGLMANPQGQIIDLPITSNFREGLDVTEYVISSYGARKGLVDTAIRTADSGYLTRRLVDVAQDIIVRDEDCLTTDNLSYSDIFERYPTNLSFKDRVIGRFLAQPIFRKDQQTLFAMANTPIDVHIINELDKLEISNLKVRSPLTCNSNRSVCRRCYGWHLSYSRLVDLGEAVGILAAQSIGEPGTQLTMRTFHTGGVFSGDLTRQIRAPFAGTVFFKLQSKTTLVRTMHGEKGFRLYEQVILYIENIFGGRSRLVIPEGNILLVNCNQKVLSGQVLGEIKKDSNLSLEEDRNNVYTQVSGETFFQNISIKNTLDNGSLNKITTKAGLIWVLKGEYYPLPKHSKVQVNLGQKVYYKKILAQEQTLNKHSGLVKIESTSFGKVLKILKFSLILKNTSISIVNEKFPRLTVLNNNNQTEFHLTVNNNEFISNGQTIALLNENQYQTKTGGIICYDIEKVINKKKRNPKKVFSGSIYWIPEETHNLNATQANNLKVKFDTIIKKGCELWPGSFSKVGGLVQFDDTTRELVIKPGELFLLAKKDEKIPVLKNVFFKPGEVILDKIIVQKLSYVEMVSITDTIYLFIRPVIVYNVPRKKGFSLQHLFFPITSKQCLKIKTIKRIFFQNWEQVKSNTGVKLLQTFLTLEKKKEYVNLQPQLEFFHTSNRNKIINLKVSFYEVFKKQNIVSNNKIRYSLKYLVWDKQFIYANSVVTKVQISSKFGGILSGVRDNKIALGQGLLILKKTDIKENLWLPTHDKLVVQIGDLVRVGSLLTDKIKSKHSGQVYNITPTSIEIRLGRPHLIAEGTILKVESGSIVQRSDMLATLVYKKFKTVDIVQGLPKVEEILEARKIKNSCFLSPSEGQIFFRNSNVEIINVNGSCCKISESQHSKIKEKFANGNFVKIAAPLTDGPVNPHEMLNVLFQYYQRTVNTYDACKLSFKYLQLFLVNEVQRTYLAQGVQIADKHIEIIVKQMTSKVRVEESGDTTLLPGEILSLYQVHLITKTEYSVNETLPFYTPILLGLTKASLNSDSFISAASFQETTRVLTEAAIEGKKDWLYGLKENVIIGRLIPAGTGFNCYQHLAKSTNGSSNRTAVFGVPSSSLKEQILTLRLKGL